MGGIPLCDECFADRLEFSSAVRRTAARHPLQDLNAGRCRCRIERGSIERALAPAGVARGRALFGPRSALGSLSLPGGGWPPGPRARRPDAASPRARLMWALRAALSDGAAACAFESIGRPD